MGWGDLGESQKQVAMVTASSVRSCCQGYCYREEKEEKEMVGEGGVIFHSRLEPGP